MLLATHKGEEISVRDDGVRCGIGYGHEIGSFVRRKKGERVVERENERKRERERGRVRVCEREREGGREGGRDGERGYRKKKKEG